ncbi:diguanylate cyclase (GGDEF)-like protein [Bacillus luteolus]|nr:diguanylate cyclase (GGDEF)-like protein [Cytobacillus luteolus]
MVLVGVFFESWVVMDKYKKKLMDNMNKQLGDWFEGNESVPHEDIYRFLHSVAGTASSIGLHAIGDTARNLMNSLTEDESKLWGIKDLKVFLFELLTLIYDNDLEDKVLSEAPLMTMTGNEPVILLIDDETSMLMYLKEELQKQGWMVNAIANPIKAIAAFYDIQPDCVIIDVYMGQKSGFEILAFLKEKVKQQFLPTIMISSDNSKSIRMQSYQMGADDFIAKPFELDELTVRIKRHIERKNLIDNLLLVDELTRVYNRKYLNQAYDQLRSELIRNKETFSIVMIDIDHFKRVNDTYGHLVGDQVLKQFATFLTNHSRPGDIVIRFGGEEFILILPELSVDESKKVIERLILKCRDTKLNTEKGELSCTFSAGVVEVNNPTQSLEEWLLLADNALYDAKESGRNQLKVADQVLNGMHQKIVKVAVVDDDPIIRTMLVDLLETLGKEGQHHLEIESFKDGSAFINNEWSHTEHRYLIILDGIMPRMDGIEVLQQLRSKNSDRYTVIMLTSRKSERDIARALQLGADDYITKPFKLLELETRIRHLLKRMK